MGCRVTYNVDEAIARRGHHQSAAHPARAPAQDDVSRASANTRSLFGLNKARLAKTKPDALIMHPGPINRGVEIDSEIADCERSLILEQVTNGLAVRMAVLFLLNGGKGPQEVA